MPLRLAVTVVAWPDSARDMARPAASRLSWRARQHEPGPTSRGRWQPGAASAGASDSGPGPGRPAGPPGPAGRAAASSS